MDPNFYSIVTGPEQPAFISLSSQHSSHSTSSQFDSNNNIGVPFSVQPYNHFHPIQTQHSFQHSPVPYHQSITPIAPTAPIAGPVNQSMMASNQPVYVLTVPPQQHLPMAASHVIQQTPNAHGTHYHPGIHETSGPMIIGGRLRHGGNAHTELKHVCKYFSYREGESLKSMGHQSSPKEQLLPLFVQMFPSEHKDHAAVTFENVMLQICGPGAGSVVGVEPRSDTSFIVFVRTSVVWHVIYNMRYRVLMDRHGFWYAENLQQYAMMKDYCENVRTLPQQARHSKTDGMPSMPLVVELSRTMSRTSITAPPAPAPFDIQMAGTQPSS